MGQDFSAFSNFPSASTTQQQQLQQIHYAPPQNLVFAAQLDSSVFIRKVQKHIKLVAAIGNLIKCSRCGEKREMSVFPCNHAICSSCINSAKLINRFVVCPLCRSSFLPQTLSHNKIGQICSFWPSVVKNEAIPSADNEHTIPLVADMGKYPILGCRGDLPVEALSVALGRIGFYSPSSYFTLSQTCRMLYICAQQEATFREACGITSGGKVGDSKNNKDLNNILSFRKDISASSGPFSTEERDALDQISCCCVDPPTLKKETKWSKIFISRLLMVPGSPNLFLVSPYVVYKYGMWEMGIIDTPKLGKALVCLKDQREGLIFPAVGGSSVYFNDSAFVRITSEMNFKAKVVTKSAASANQKAHVHFVEEFKRMPKLRYDFIPDFGFVNLSFSPFRFIFVDKKQKTDQFLVIFENEQIGQITTYSTFDLHEDGQIFVDSMFIDFSSVCKLATEKKVKESVPPEKCPEHNIEPTISRICPSCLSCAAKCKPIEGAIGGAKCSCKNKGDQCSICFLCQDCLENAEKIDAIDTMGIAARHVIAQKLRETSGNADRAVERLFQMMQ